MNIGEDKVTGTLADLSSLFAMGFDTSADKDIHGFMDLEHFLQDASRGGWISQSRVNMIFDACFVHLKFAILIAIG